MLPAQRKEEIYLLLNEKKFVSVTELCEALHYSQSTVRRDLKQMEQEQLVTCAHGGAVANIHPNMETPLAIRRSTNRHVKSLIARRAADMVEDNQMIIMDASTTVMEIIPFLRKKKNLTIITCCLSTAIQITEQLNCTLICSGGRYHAPVASLVGSSAEAMLKNWYADFMFFSANSIDVKNGLTDQGEEIAHLKSVMLQRAKQTVFLADSNKFGKTSACRIFPAPITHIITNYDPRFDMDCWKEYHDKMIFVDK